MIMSFANRSLDLSVPRVMGVLNVTPDSFFDGGDLYRDNQLDVSVALKRAQHMVDQGADFIDVGGESTRPGAAPVSLAEEMDRVLPMVERLAPNVDAVISVDTSSPELMREASKLGAGLINDVRSFTRDGALSAAADTGLPVCLMHMQGSPQTMQHSPEYDSVVDEVNDYFASRIEACVQAGISKQAIMLDPGIGFGKSDEHNLSLIRSLRLFSALSCPLLVGVSRKSLIGRLLGRKPKDRLAGSLGFAYASLAAGAKIVRVHDVAETADIVKVFSYVHQSSIN